MPKNSNLSKPPLILSGINSKKKENRIISGGIHNIINGSKNSSTPNVIVVGGGGSSDRIGLNGAPPLRPQWWG
jgi:hypothetical protein